MSLHQFSLLILCALVCVLYTACMCVFAVYYQCLLGKSCRMGGKCLSPSQWCDGVKDCSHGEDEAQCCKTFTHSPTPSLPNQWMCLCTSHHEQHGGWVATFLCSTVRLHGTNFILETFSTDSQKWMPVCAENWDNNYGRAVCEQMGYSRYWLYSSLPFTAQCWCCSWNMKCSWAPSLQLSNHVLLCHRFAPQRKRLEKYTNGRNQST